MKRRNTISNKEKTSKNINLHSSFVCPADFKNCKYYHSDQPEESRCQNDSSVGLCVKEYFDFLSKEEVITENGDTK